jgi:hypothetical protein
MIDACALDLGFLCRFVRLLVEGIPINLPLLVGLFRLCELLEHLVFDFACLLELG